MDDEKNPSNPPQIIPNSLKKKKNLLPVSADANWIQLVETCSLGVLLDVIIKNPSILLDSTVQKRFFSIEEKESDTLTPQGQKYVKEMAEKIRHNFDYEVVEEWSWWDLGYKYTIKNTGFNPPAINNTSISVSADALVDVKSACELLASIPYHSYGPMPADQNSFFHEVANKSNTYFKERGINLQIGYEEQNGKPHIEFRKYNNKRTTPAEIYFLGSVNEPKEHKESKAAKTSVTFAQSNDNAKKNDIKFIDNVISSNAPNFQLTVDSNTNNAQKSALSSSAENRTAQIKQELDKRAKEEEE